MICLIHYTIVLYFRNFSKNEYHNISAPFGVGGDARNKLALMKVAGADAPISENRLFEDLYDMEAISAIKALELAGEMGIPVCRIVNSVPGDITARVVACDGGSGDFRVRVVVLRVELERIWSEQFGSAIGKASNFIPGGTGSKDEYGRLKKYIIVGAGAGDDQIHIGGLFDVAPLESSFQKVLKVKIQSQDTTPELKSFTSEIVNNQLEVHAAASIESSTIQDSYDVRYVLTAYLDLNENDTMDVGEKLKHTSYEFIGVNSTTYTTDRAILRAGGKFCLYDLPIASHHLLAFTEKQLWLSERTAVTAKELDFNTTSHNIGAKYNTNGVAQIPLFEYGNISPEAEKMKTEPEYQNIFCSLFSEESIINEIKANLLGKPVGEACVIIRTNLVRPGRIQEGSKDLHLSFAGFQLNISSINATFSVKEISPYGFLVELTDLDVKASIDDLYDFDFDKTWELEKYFGRAKAGAAVQAGYDSIDLNGEIFYIRMVMDQNNYNVLYNFSCEIPIFN